MNLSRNLVASALCASLCLAGVAFAAPQTTTTTTTTTTQTTTAATAPTTPFVQDPKPEKPETHPVVTIKTSRGDIRIRLYPEDAPITAANFLKLVKKGFYDGLTFHRVVPGFVIQGGDPNGSGTGGPGYTIPDEKNHYLKHMVGAVAMAKTSEPNSAGSQFYIVIENPQPRLDEMGYTVFGQVIAGQDVAEQIKVGDKMIKVTAVEPLPTVDGPASVDQRIDPVIPDSLRSHTFSASVTLQAKIKKDGKASYELTQKSGDADIDKLVLDTVKKWTWKPAVKNGVAVDSTQDITIDLKANTQQ